MSFIVEGEVIKPTIDHDVPLPNPRRRHHHNKPLYDFSEMKKGSSFFEETTPEEQVIVRNRLRSRVDKWKKRVNAKTIFSFYCVVENGRVGVRCYCISDGVAP